MNYSYLYLVTVHKWKLNFFKKIIDQAYEQTENAKKKFEIRPVW